MIRAHLLQAADEAVFGPRQGAAAAAQQRQGPGPLAPASERVDEELSAVAAPPETSANESRIVASESSRTPEPLQHPTGPDLSPAASAAPPAPAAAQAGALPLTGGAAAEAGALPLTGGATEEAGALPLTGGATEEAGALPLTGCADRQQEAGTTAGLAADVSSHSLDPEALAAARYRSHRLRACMFSWEAWARVRRRFRQRQRSTWLSYGLWRHRHVGRPFDWQGIKSEVGRTLAAIQFEQWRRKTVAFLRQGSRPRGR